MQGVSSRDKLLHYHKARPIKEAQSPGCRGFTWNIGKFIIILEDDVIENSFETTLLVVTFSAKLKKE